MLDNKIFEGILSLKTKAEIEEFRNKVNEMCDKRSDYVKLCTVAAEASGSDFGAIKEAFENISGELFKKREGRKLINRYAETVRESKNLRSLNRIYEALRKAESASDSRYFVNSLVENKWESDRTTLDDDVLRLGRILSEAILMLGDSGFEMPVSDRRLFNAVRYIMENRRDSRNIAEFSMAAGILEEHVSGRHREKTASPFDDAPRGGSVMEMMTELNEKYSSLSESERSVLHEIYASDDRKSVFDKYKRQCEESLMNTMKTFGDKGDDESAQRINEIIEKVREKEYSPDTVAYDIMKMTEFVR